MRADPAPLIPTRARDRQSLMAELLRSSPSVGMAAPVLRPIIASLVAGRVLGEGILSASLGLSTSDFAALWHDCFCSPPWLLTDGNAENIPELDDLTALLLEYRAGEQAVFAWMARIVACGCAGRDHLWQDLGLASRNELTLLMRSAFPSLAALNGGDMKWKKFLYRHYCTREGIYCCPAPSCGECIDYPLCFAPEE